ncbi:MAG: CoA transferase [Dehalococcoidales bacterium]|nr:CoA transferase [Dehalococcoidales bacterium]
MSGILEGLKVMELGHVVAIPAATAAMADWGAEVIKIEPLTGDMSRGILSYFTEEEKARLEDPNYINWYYQFLNRGKRGIALDLKTAEGKKILNKLIKWADIFLTNYETGTLNKLGADYESLSKINPRIIYGLLTGYGTVGPDKDERGFDFSAAWARSGIMHMLGEPGCIPPPQRGGMMDRVAGAHIVGGVLAGLYHRDKIGKGQKIEISLYHTGVWTLAEDIQPTLLGYPPDKFERAKARSPLWNSYRTKDSKWFWAAMLQPELSWGDFCRVLGHPEWENNPTYNTREARYWSREELIKKIDEIIITRTLQEWEAIFRGTKVIYGRVQTPAEVVKDPQALANNFFVDLHHPSSNAKVVATPVKFCQNPSEVRSAAPEVGQHTEEVLLEHDYSWEDIARFKELGVIL